jgi:Uncharacterised nucleotidyltransferase
MVSCSCLGAEDELVLLCIHGAKHFWERLMWVADVTALLPSVDWNKAVRSAQKVGAVRMLRLGVSLASQALQFDLSNDVQRDLNRDPTAARIASQIAARLSQGQLDNVGLVRRALLRFRMPQGFFRGAAYLFRLSFSPTEEDWGSREKRSWPVNALIRPLRLARKYQKIKRNEF